MGKIGRNAPCPCGSGKKAKKCCFLLVGEGRSASPADGFANEIHQALGGRPANSMEELQALVADLNERRNRSARGDFEGLSPEQMHRLLDFPFSSPQFVTFADPVPEPVSAPILTLFGCIAEAIGERGLKPTAQGNLPRALCREVAQTFWGDEEYREHTRFGGINKEENFSDLHVTRVVAELAGLVRKYRGHFILSRNCRQLLADGGVAAVYPMLFRIYVERFNWWYGTRFPEVPFLQQSFLFSLYLLTRLGEDWNPTTRYEDAFLQAFPQVLDEVPASPYRTPEKEFRSAYNHIVLHNFSRRLGLAEVEPVGEQRILASEHRVRRRPLLQQVIRFHM
ncbi:MAG: SEC-C metal-binding domain-containing protein [Deferrisomatales bacterium]|nr:SEC-C metal-binding domain-containing protein [Deferrisomatales bacterium]